MLLFGLEAMIKPLILIIDDDPNLRRTLSDILRTVGYEALAAKDGTEGLAVLQQRPVNVALIDLKLPDMSGLEVLSRVKADYPFTEAIILTGNATLNSAIEATNKDAFSYLQKPYEIDQLLLHIRRVIEKQKAEEKIRKYEERLEELVIERMQEFEIAKLQAEAGDRARTEFIMNMGHELQTPLNSIIGFSTVLRDELMGSLNEKQKEYVAGIINSGRYLQDLVLNDLKFAEAESGRLGLKAGRFSVRDMINSATARVKGKIARHKMSLDLAMEPDADIEIEENPGTFRQILFHLLSNAVKFTPDGGRVRVSVRLIAKSDWPQATPLQYAECPSPQRGEGGLQSEFSKPQSAIELSVADTGIGIKPEDLPGDFKEITRPEAPLTKKNGDMGPGLSIVYRIVKEHNGYINCYSEPGNGTTFKILLPVIKSEVSTVRLLHM